MAAQPGRDLRRRAIGERLGDADLRVARAIIVFDSIGEGEGAAKICLRRPERRDRRRRVGQAAQRKSANFLIAPRNAQLRRRAARIGVALGVAPGFGRGAALSPPSIATPQIGVAGGAHDHGRADRARQIGAIVPAELAAAARSAACRYRRADRSRRRCGSGAARRRCRASRRRRRRGRIFPARPESALAQSASTARRAQRNCRMSTAAARAATGRRLARDLLRATLVQPPQARVCGSPLLAKSIGQGGGRRFGAPRVERGARVRGAWRWRKRRNGARARREGQQRTADPAELAQSCPAPSQRPVQLTATKRPMTMTAGARARTRRSISSAARASKVSRRKRIAPPLRQCRRSQPSPSDRFCFTLRGLARERSISRRRKDLCQPSRNFVEPDQGS